MNENKNMEFNQVLEDYFQESLYLYKIDGTFREIQDTMTLCKLFI